MNNHTPTTNPRVDAFARELALALRRITGRSDDTGERLGLPSPLPPHSSNDQEKEHETDSLSSPQIA